MLFSSACIAVSLRRGAVWQHRASAAAMTTVSSTRYHAPRGRLYSSGRCWRAESAMQAGGRERQTMFGEVSVDDRFTVRVWQAGDGRPLVFLHGFEGHPGDAPFLQRLAQHHRVVAPEMPGFSGSMPGAHELQDIVDYALFYRRLIDEQIGEPVDLVGHDLGGMLAAEV